MEDVVSQEIEPGWQVYCTEASGAFEKGKLYIRNEDNTAFDQIDIASGTDAVDDLIAEMSTVHKVEMPTLTPEMFIRLTNSGATITNDPGSSSTGGLLLQTNTTSGANATAELFGLGLSYAQTSVFQIAMRYYDPTNFTRLRIGVEAESASAGNDSNRRYGIEGCSTSGTNWLVFSSDGTTRSTLSTASPVAPGAHTSYRVTKEGASVVLRVGLTQAANKTNNVPTSGNTSQKIFRIGIQNTAGENKRLSVTALKLYGTIGDTRWV